MAGLQILKLAIIFVLIVLLLGLKRPLYQAMLAGVVSTAALFLIPPLEWVNQLTTVLTSVSSMSIIFSLYLISFLQKILEFRGQIKFAQQDLNGLFHNRRVNASGAPIFIGLLPSAAAMLLCGDIVRDSASGYLSNKEQAVLASWSRHVMESILPTYSGVLLMSSLSGVPLPSFMLGMIIPVFVLVAIVYVPYLRKIPKDPGTPRSTNRIKDALNLFRHLWTLLIVLLLILVFNLSAVSAVSIVIVAAIMVYRLKLVELKPLFVKAFELQLILNTFLVLVLKEFISHTGVLQLLPDVFSALPIPLYLVFGLLFFVGCIISGTNGIIALGTPMAFAAIPSGGMPLMVFLMCMCHAASQISPTHVCLVVASDYFGITLGELVRKTLPLALIFCVLMTGYYQLLLVFF